MARALGALAAYLLVFVVLAWPWLRAAGHAIPLHPAAASLADARLFGFILAWVAHALATDPTRLFDAPIYFPAPGQLTGSEGLFTSQVLFSPVFAVTGNATLATGLSAFATYPLAAFAMGRLLVALGCLEGVAWTAGLAFALGPLRVPATFQVLQYPNLFLPLAALALTRLRDRPTARRAALLGAVLVAGFLSSFYMAVMLAVTALVWGGAEVARRSPGRGRFARLAAGAGAAAAAPAVAAGLPYLARDPRGAETIQQTLASQSGELFDRVAAGVLLFPAELVSTAFAVAGLLALAARSPSARFVARRGALVAAIGVALLLGPVLRVGELEVPLPFSLIAVSPARFFRLPWRFAVVAGFGAALLAAAALEAAARRLGPRAGTTLCAAACAVLLATRGRELAGPGLDEVAAQHESAYNGVREAARERGGGPLLELPSRLPSGERTEPDSMLGATRHGQPLVLGFTGYPPPHRDLVLDRISGLPTGLTLDDLVDMTRLRWVLLRPVDQWARPKQRRAIAALDGLEPVWSQHGWDLLRVTRTPSHPAWFAALAAGPQAGHTLLGTPLERIAAPASAARVRSIRRRFAAGARVPIVVDVENRGVEPWPATAPADAQPERTVWLDVGFRPRDAQANSTTVVAAVSLRLPRDVPPGESLTFKSVLPAPGLPGTYDVELGLRQADGPCFAGSGNESLGAVVEVFAASARRRPLGAGIGAPARGRAR